jgi:GNAT superfamily N-acetyltransferase
LPSGVTLAVAAPITAQAVTELRVAVGWDRSAEDYPAAFAGYWAWVCASAPDGALIGWLAIISDGVRHAVLLDVIIHPAWQRRGVGRAMVSRAVGHCMERGVSIIHVDFEPETAAFYARCGFSVGLGGIYSAE